MSLIYLFSLLIILIGFTAYPLISKKYIGGFGYKKFLPIFLLFSAVGAFTVPFLVYHSFKLNLSYLPILALLGLMYTVAAYLIFYSIERYNVGIINSIVGSQDVLIAVFSALFFIISEFKAVLISFIIIITGIAVLGVSNKGKSKLSVYVILSLLGVFLWVFMWVVFYTINTSFPLTYFAVLQGFSFLFSVPITFILRGKSATHKIKNSSIQFILIAGLLNGFVTGVFSFAYKFNAILTPFIAQLGVPLVLILSFFLLKERIKKSEIFGVLLIILGTFLYILL